MKLVVLGSGTSVPHPQRASAAFWLETVQGSILLDCSADAAHRMAQEELPWMDLDAIWISHLHLDHCAGLAPFLFSLKWAPGNDRRKPLKIFGCEGITKLLRAIDESHDYELLEQRFPVEFHELPATAKGRAIGLFAGLECQVISTPHRAESLAIRVSDPEGTTVVFSSDTGYAESLAEFARAADLLMLECSFPRNKPTPKHLELADAVRIAKVAEPRTLLLTHLYPEWDQIDLEVEAKTLWPGKTVAARDGLRLEIKK